MKKKLKVKKLFLTTLLGVALAQFGHAQGDCYSQSGCSDYSNFGYYSSGANDLEYDNYVSGFHSTVVRDIDGTFKIWGEMTKADGKGFNLEPVPINPGNYPGLTGTPLKVAIGSSTIRTPQFILLTDDNKLWTWGNAGSVFSESLTTYTNEYVPDSDNGGSNRDVAPFQEFSLGLPSGVTAADVKMMFATEGALLITTCSGDVFAIVNYWGNVGNGGTSATNVWHKVQKAPSSGGGDLTNIVAARGSSGGFLALDDAGNLWAWGYNTWDGTNPMTTSNYAVPVALPTGATGSIKMIGVTGDYSRNTYYVLYENGSLYALGSNEAKQLGDWTTTSSPTWVQPRYDSPTGPVMDNIKWISPNEHSNLYAAINVLNDDKKIFNWGEENKYFLGRGLGMTTVDVDPGEPTSFEAGYSNSDIMAVETGGHTTMMLRECEDDFGYMGHRVNGSMGDNSPAGEITFTVHFHTNAIQLCGANVVDATLASSVEGPYYVGNSLTLIGTPSGGTYAISPVSPTSATLVDSNLTFTTSGTVRVDYTVTDPTCGVVTVSKTFDVQSTPNIVTIPGNIFIDADGDGEIDVTETGISNDKWANLTDPNGIVIASVKVNEDGTYQFNISTNDLSEVGDYSVVLTNYSNYKGNLLTNADLPNGTYEYTGTNRGGAGDTGNKTGKINIGDLSTITTTTTTNPVNFGMQQPPTADPKSFYVAENTFSSIPPTGFPIVTGYKSIPMSSTAFTGLANGGTLSGSDPEDCAVSGSCNTGDNTTFVINNVNSNTQLYYDFGSGPVLIDVSGGSVTIPNFDASKLEIYGQEGAGVSGDELGFNYSIIDKAGAQSAPVPYTITTSAPLPIGLFSFNATAQNASVLLDWITVSEKNNKGFEIERSTDAKNWSNIGFVNTKATNGNSTAKLAYDFTDASPLNGSNYYRLKQVDFNGASDYSTVRLVNFSIDQSIRIYPNPSHQGLTLEGVKEGQTIVIYNILGQVMKRIIINQNGVITINITDLADAYYQLVIINDNQTVHSFKFIKN